jgi:DNA-binding transcriptional ArsR family regulator
VTCSRSTPAAASSASDHLGALVAGGLVQATPQGRHRYYSLAGPDVGAALEALARISPHLPASGLQQVRAVEELRRARTCYDHLAGEVGVALLDALIARGWLLRTTPGLELSPAGERSLEGLGVDLAGARRSRRIFARPCLDWTERRYHLAGALGAALAAALLERAWYCRQGAGRGLEVTAAGAEALRRLSVPAPVARAAAGSPRHSGGDFSVGGAGALVNREGA